MPFSDCSTISTSAGTWFGTRVGNPMPRLTYCPSVSSRAARAAISSRVSGISGSLGARPHGAAFDPLVGRLLGGQRDHPLHVHPGQVDLVRVELARLHQPLDLGDGDPPGHRAERVEVAGTAPEHQVAVP